ncbi:hypothetical protein ASE91_18205 [Sphingomonas sp. Leaf62]|nr:hypothetical protein ASE91_18205 [Sphingomonas sp. Leaf62]
MAGRNAPFRSVADIAVDWQIAQTGKRSGVPHRDDELTLLSREQLEAELSRARLRLSLPVSTKMAKLAQQRVHWLEGALAQRD